MDKYNRFFFGLSSVVVPFAVYFLVNHFFFAPTAKTLKNENGTLPTKNTANKKPVVNKTKDVQPTKPKESRKVKILYGTCTGTAKLFAEKLTKRIDSCTKFIVEAVNLKDYNEDKLDTEDIVLFICSTWTDGQPPESARQFFEWLKDYATDFRVSKNHLSKLKFAVFGLGGDIYAEHFAKAPKDIHEYLVTLGATAILPIDFGDDASDLEMKYNKWSSRIATAVQNIYNADSNSTKKIRSNVKSSKANALQNQQKIVKAEESAIANKKQVKQNSECCQSGGDSQEASTCCGGNSAAGADEAEEEFVEEEEDIINNTYITMDQVDVHQDVVAPIAAKKAVRVTKGVKKQSSSGCCSSTSDHKHTSEEGVDPNLLAPVDDETEHYSDDQEEEEDYDNEKNEALLDLEDLGSKMNKAQRNALKDQLSGQDGSEEFKREMVTKLQRKALTKEGYRIIGTHSAVKLCRWTKNQMRGRGGCYKHSFYGITSYQCMEATPSLACANKCVFCWRHHKNPVGTEWRWKEDEPAFIVNEAVELHRSMINEMRGVPGVQPERLLDAFNVRHCALSLVGEPIMYPRINEMLQELHKREISSFMVTNAQFPERIEQLDPVTQLYVSVDASNKESLKAIDRPLFKDFWERFLASLKAMAAKKQRTVYRMTLVSGWNMNEDGYVELIESGLPDFIEIKAMTYCGKSDASSLTMQNVPWHKDVCEYGEAICNRLVERGVISTRYSIATEHEHSCCILLAREDKFLVNGQWNTWINYPKFNALIAEYYASGKKKLFTSEDYMAPTPEWALYKSAARGFDPEEQRWHRNKTTGALVENEYKSSESGCG